MFTKLVKLTKNSWDDQLMCSSVFKWLSMLVPVALLWHFSPDVFEKSSKVGILGSGIRVNNLLSLTPREASLALLMAAGAAMNALGMAIIPLLPLSAKVTL